MNMKSTKVNVFKGSKIQYSNLHGDCYNSICPRCGKPCCKPVYAYERNSLPIPPAVPPLAFKADTFARSTSSIPSAATISAPATDDVSHTGDEIVSSAPVPQSEAEQAFAAQEPETEDSPPAQEPETEDSPPAQEPETEDSSPVQEPETEDSPLAQALQLEAERNECESPFEPPPEHERLSSQQLSHPPGDDGLYGRGLLSYAQWWKLRAVDVSVRGALLSGIPALIEKNTLRIINDKYSYFIPLEKVDYIRTGDGLSMC